MMNDKWYDKTVTQVAERLETDLSAGLSRSAVRTRRKRVGKNEIFPAPQTSFRTYLKNLMTDFTTILLILVLLLALLFGRKEEYLVMLAITVVYAVVAVLAYVRAHRVLDGMGRYALPSARVVREGKLFMVKQEELVQGDILFLSAGDIVPCDARLMEADELEVLEVNITSVPHAVKKNADFIEYHDIAPAQQENMLFASTILTAGQGKAIVCEVGGDTLVCKMRKNVSLLSHDQLAVFDSLKRFCTIWTLAMDLFVVLLTGLDLLIGEHGVELFEGFLTGLSLAASTMSEFVLAFAYVILACGIFSAVKKYRDVNAGALVKNAAKLSELKDLTCLLIPKEGAFSIRDMKIERVWANGEVHQTGEHGYEKNCSQTLRYALLSTGLYGSARILPGAKGKQAYHSPEEEAILSECQRLGLYNVSLDRKYPMIEHIAGGKRSRFDTTLFAFESSFVVAVRGEYSAILDNCRYYTENGRVLEMSPEKRSEIKIAAALLTKEAFRVIAVASRNTLNQNLARLSACQSDLTFEGFLAVREPMLPGAAKNVSKCLSAGMKIIVLSEDVSEHNLFLAQSLGIITDETQAVTSSEISGMREGVFRLNAEKYRLYEGLTLSQKRFLLQYLKEKGEKVGVLGSELDDIILLKEADVSYSQSVTIPSGKNGIDLTTDSVPSRVRNIGYSGRNGCEALKFISDVIVSEADKRGSGGFNAIIESILNAKVIYRNFLRMIRYLMTVQVARLSLVLFSLLTKQPLMTPSQILFSGLILDFLAVLVIAFEKPTSDLFSLRDDLEEKIRHPILSCPDTVLTGLIWAAASIALLCLLGGAPFSMDPTAVGTCSFLSFLLTQFVLLNENLKEKGIFLSSIRMNGVYVLYLVTLLSLLISLRTIPAAGEAFSVTLIGFPEILVILAVPLLMLALCEVYKLLSSRPVFFLGEEEE